MKNLYVYTIAGLFLLAAQTGAAQSASNDIKFASFLTGEGRYSDAVVVLHQAIHEHWPLKPKTADTIYYSLGWNYYMIKQLDSASRYFSCVSDSSVFFLKSKFYESFCLIHMGKYEDARQILSMLETVQDSSIQLLANFQTAGLDLINNNSAGFSARSSRFRGNFYPIAEGEKHFKEYQAYKSLQKKRSAVLAGILSAVLPGAGKFYAGYKGQAAGAFLPNFFLGAVAVENYIRSGYKSPNFIITASLFSLFYVGNIWGSVLSVKIRSNEIQSEIRHHVLLDLHIPLRRIFD